MKSVSLFFMGLVIVFTFSMCEKEGVNKSRDTKSLQKKYAAIIILAEQQTCNDPETWRIAPIGAKACGGPAGYIAYSSRIDTTAFFQKIKEYTSEQDKFNRNWGVYSDCSLTLQPSGIKCVGGKATLVY